MENIKVSGAHILRVQVERNVKASYKQALVILEELRSEHKDTLERLRNALPDDCKGLVSLSDYWTENRVDSVRDRVLTAGNNAIRAIEEQIANLRVEVP